MTKLLGWYCRLLEGLMALLLAVMVVLVFGNVVLRYVFNSGITVSDEIARWMFVWLTFLGAIVALRDHTHMGTDMVVSMLPPVLRKACAVLGTVLMLGVVWLLFEGGLAQARINADVSSPVAGMSTAIFYASGVVFAVSAAVILLVQLVRTLTGQARGAELELARDGLEPSGAELASLAAAEAEERARPAATR